MKAGLNRLCGLTGFACGFVLFAAAQSSPTYPPFPGYPRTPDADASIRHEIEVPTPTALIVQRTENQLSVSYNLSSLRNVKITLGKKMSLGMKAELRVYVEGGTRPRQARIRLAGIGETTTAPPDISFLKSTSFVNSLQDGIPALGKRYMIEEEISLFETDVPPQHMWSPTSPAFRVLWTEVLKTIG